MCAIVLEVFEGARPMFGWQVRRKVDTLEESCYGHMIYQPDQKIYWARPLDFCMPAIGIEVSMGFFHVLPYKHLADALVAWKMQFDSVDYFVVPVTAIVVACGQSTRLASDNPIEDQKVLLAWAIKDER